MTSAKKWGWVSHACPGYLVSERKLSFSPISASDKNFNPRNTQCVTAGKILIFLDLDEKSWFSFTHYLSYLTIEVVKGKSATFLALLMASASIR